MADIDHIVHDPTEDEQQNLGRNSNRPPSAADTPDNKPYTGNNPFLTDTDGI